MTSMETIRILYIEDDECSAGLTLDYLKRDPDTIFKVTRTCTLDEGLKYLDEQCKLEEENKIDIILLDLVLPNSHGVATYKAVVKKCKFIPVVIISGHEDLALKCMKLGAQEYLVKPLFTGESLKRVIRYSYERSRATREKLALERKFRQIVNNTPVGLHNYKLEGDELYFISYNPAADMLLKIDHSELVGKPIEEAFPGLLNTNVKKEYINVARTGKTFSEIREYKDHHISKGFFKVHAFQISKNNITVSFEDITRQILSEYKYKNLVEATNAGIYEIDFRTGRFVYVNHVIANILGYTKEELLEISVYDILTEESTVLWIERMKALERGDHIDKSAEYTVITKDGNLRYVIITAEYIEQEDGTITGANVVAIDITESVLAKKEAKRKEERIFNELEHRIHQWRNELISNVKENKKNRDLINDQIKNLSSQSEVV